MNSLDPRCKHISLSNDAFEFLSGLLLGDGHLDHVNESTSAYQHGSKFKNFLIWLSAKLASYGIEQSGKIRCQAVYLSSTGKRYDEFFYDSRRYVELGSLQKKWYRKALKTEVGRRFFKVLPPNLALTPLTCQQWYIGDGSLFANPKSNYILLNAQGFSSGEGDSLVSLLGRLGFKVYRHSDNSIRISTNSTPDFLNYIGPCPIKCYEYKWNLNYQ